MPEWVEIIVKLTPAFVTLVIGGIATFIAYLQYKHNRDKLRLDLFNKRFEAYEKLQEFFHAVMREGEIKREFIPILSEARYKAKFLFGSDIKDKFDELWNMSFEAMKLSRKIHGPKSLPIGEERSKVCEDESKLIKAILDEMGDSASLFKKYLHFN